MMDFLKADLTEEFGVATEYFECIDSTNAEAKRQIRAGLKENKLFWAGEQTAGRGRMNRSFHSGKKEGLFFSFALHLPAMDENTVRLTAKTGVAVIRGIEENLNAALSIKWVNDLILNGKKVAGILVETLPDARNQGCFAVIGVGINTGFTPFPPELSGIAASLAVPEEYHLPLMKSILFHLQEECRRLEDCSYLTDYRKYSCVIGKNITFGNLEQMEKGTAVAIDDSGALIVQKEDGSTVLLNTGEISVRLQ